MALHLLVARQFPPGPPLSPEYMAQTNAPTLLAIEGTLYGLSMSAILMRFYVRIFMLKIFGWDVFLVAFTIASNAVMMFQCTPIKASWTFSLRPPVGHAKCYSPKVFQSVGVFNSSVNIATDLLFAILPIPMVWRLQVNLRTRIGLAVVLSLGFFASAVAIYKLPIQYNFLSEPDMTGHGSWYYVWQQVELHVGILAACLPTLKPLMASFFGQVRTFTKARTVGSGALSQNVRTAGYLKHDDGRSGNSFAMTGVSDRGKDPYDDDVALGKDSYTVTTGAGLSNRRNSTAGESDESILGHGNRRSDGLSRSMMIVRTTEVHVTR
ncbi:hypothetical protein ACEQ8H_004240 [Pleosporales sp. CAS-2024a]